MDAISVIREDISKALHKMARLRLADGQLQNWLAAFDESGRGSASRRAVRMKGIYEDAAPVPGVVINPLTDDMNTTRPRASRILGSTAWVTAIWDMTLTSSCSVRSSRDSPSTGPFTMMPALLTTPFSGAGSRSGRAVIAAL